MNRVFLVIGAVMVLAAAAQAQSVRVDVAGNPPQFVKRVDPTYPRSALEMRVQGVVRMSVIIGADGRFLRAEKVSGEPHLVEAALSATKQWVFVSTGKEESLPVTVLFSFDQGDDGPNRPDHLVTQGEELDSEEAQALEQSLTRDANNKSVRAKLLGYYTVKRKIPERRKMLAWFVSHDPSSVALMTDHAILFPLGNSLADPEGYRHLKSLWLKCAEVKSPEKAAWSNAVHFLSWQDKPEAERILLELDKHRMTVNIPPGLPPQFREAFSNGANGMFARELGALYAKALMGLTARDDSGKPVFDPADANSEFARHAMAALESSSSDQMLAAAQSTFSTYRNDQGDPWESILARIRKRRAEIAGK